MQLTWDNIDNFTITKNGYFKPKLIHAYYLCAECISCSALHLVRKRQLNKGHGKFCSHNCANSNVAGRNRPSPGLKICTRCKEVKKIDAFYKDSQQKDGRSPYCKNCRKKYYLNNADRIREANNKYNFLHREERRLKAKERYWQKKDEILKKRGEWYDKNKGYCSKYNADYRSNNIEKLKEYIEKNKKRSNRVSLKRAKEKCASKHLMERIKEKDPRYEACFRNNFIYIKCYYCKKYYIPLNKQVEHFLNRPDGFNNLYCSDACKEKCVEYGFNPTKHIDPRSIIYKEPLDKEKVRRCQTDHLKQLQIDEYGYNYCEKCGIEQNYVELHHTLEVAKYGLEAISSASHMIVCKECHKEFTSTC